MSAIRALLQYGPYTLLPLSVALRLLTSSPCVRRVTWREIRFPVTLSDLCVCVSVDIRVTRMVRADAVYVAGIPVMRLSAVQPSWKCSNRSVKKEKLAAQVNADTAHLSNPCCLSPLSKERDRKANTVGQKQRGNIPFSDSVVFLQHKATWYPHWESCRAIRWWVAPGAYSCWCSKFPSLMTDRWW